MDNTERRPRPRRRSRLRLGLLAIAVVGLGGAALAFATQDDRASDVTAGPGANEGVDGPTRTLGGVESVAVTVSPRDELADGDVVEVVIEGLDGLPNAAILMCAGDVTEADAASSCDLGAVQQPELDPGMPVSAVEGAQRVSVARLIRIARASPDPNQAASYDCAAEPAGCVLAVGPYELPARGVLVPLSFHDEPLPEPIASLSQASDLADGQAITLVARDLVPNRTFYVRLCRAGPVEICDEIGPWLSAASDETGELETVAPVYAALYGWQGRVDCVAEPCSVVLSDRGERLAEVPVSFAAGVVAPVPRLELDPPGPYTEGQVVTVHGTAFRPGMDLSSQLAQCPAHLDTAVEERCGYPGALAGPIIVDPDGTFTASFTPAWSLATGSCVGEPGCVLAWVINHGPIAASAPLDLAP